MLIRIGTQKYHVSIGLFYFYDNIKPKIMNFFEFTISNNIFAFVINQDNPFIHITSLNCFLYPKIPKESVKD